MPMTLLSKLDAKAVATVDERWYRAGGMAGGGAGDVTRDQAGSPTAMAQNTPATAAPTADPAADPPRPASATNRSGERRARPRQLVGYIATAYQGWKSLRGLIRPDADDPVAPPKLDRSIVLASTLINLLGLALPLVVLQVYDRVLPNQAGETLFVLIAALAVVTVLDALLRIARAYLVGWTSVKHQMAISVEAVDRILHTPTQAIASERPSVHIDRLDSINALREFYGGNLHLLIIDLPFVGIYLGLIALIGGWLAIIPLVLFAAFAARILSLGGALRKVWDDKTEQSNRKYDFIMECLASISTIKALAMEPFMQRRYERLKRYSAEAGYQAIFLGNSAQTTAYLFATFSLVVLVGAGALMAIGGLLTVGSLAACVLLNGRAIQPLTRGLALYAQVQQLYSSRRRAAELFNLGAPQRVEPLAPEACRGELRITDLSFAYEPGKPLFKSIHLPVAAGSIVGIQASDGTGKSTLMKLIMGELTPASGSIEVDGIDLHGPRGEAVRPRLAYVPPYASLLRGTILENITMFGKGDAIDIARRAARLIGLENDIFQLHQGYDTMLGRGVAEELPAGLLQRIMIARALARRPNVLLFDEANASMDARSDRMLREGLEKLRGHMTMVLISQRPSLLRLADAVYKLRDGHLLRTGSDNTGISPVPPTAGAVQGADPRIATGREALAG